MIEAVIFDMDGVLADTEYYYENRRKNFLLENGIPIPEGNFIGSNEKAIWEAIVPNDPVRRQEMLMAYREYRKARPTPYGKLTDPQAEPLMNALRSRGLKVAVASSSAAPDRIHICPDKRRCRAPDLLHPAPDSPAPGRYRYRRPAGA